MFYFYFLFDQYCNSQLSIDHRFISINMSRNFTCSFSSSMGLIIKWIFKKKTSNKCPLDFIKISKRSTPRLLTSKLSVVVVKVDYIKVFPLYDRSGHVLGSYIRSISVKAGRKLRWQRFLWNIYGRVLPGKYFVKIYRLQILVGGRISGKESYNKRPIPRRMIGLLGFVELWDYMGVEFKNLLKKRTINLLFQQINSNLCKSRLFLALTAASCVYYVFVIL